MTPLHHTSLLISKLEGIILKCSEDMGLLWANARHLAASTVPSLEHGLVSCYLRAPQHHLPEEQAWAHPEAPSCGLGDERVPTISAEPHVVTSSSETQTSAPHARLQAPHINHCSFSLMKCSAQRRVSSRYRLG